MTSRTWLQLQLQQSVFVGFAWFILEVFFQLNPKKNEHWVNIFCKECGGVWSDAKFKHFWGFARAYRLPPCWGAPDPQSDAKFLSWNKTRIHAVLISNLHTCIRLNKANWRFHFQVLVEVDLSRELSSQLSFLVFQFAARRFQCPNRLQRTTFASVIHVISCKTMQSKKHKPFVVRWELCSIDLLESEACLLL